MKKIIIVNKSRSESKSIAAMCYDDFFGKLMGLMCKKSFSDKDSIILDQKFDSKINSTIHMLFMKFDIAVIWVNSNMEIVDIRKAKKWALAYMPKSSARYVIETTVDIIDEYHTGDRLEFVYE